MKNYKQHPAPRRSGQLRRRAARLSLGLASLMAIGLVCACRGPESGIGERVFVVERNAARLAVIDYREGRLIKKIPISGDMSHASMVFDAGLRYGYLALRSGTLSRIDLLGLHEAGFVQTSQNSIGLAISQDGRTVAVSEYQPGGITFVDVDRFEVRQNIPARTRSVNGFSKPSRVTGLVDAPGNRFVCALMDGNEVWTLSPDDDAPTRRANDDAGSESFSQNDGPRYTITQRSVTRIARPFDALITPEGRYYITGHIDSHKASLLDLWNLRRPARTLRLTAGGERTTPPKMPHMEAWAAAGDRIFVPAVGEKRLAVLSNRDFSLIDSIDLVGYPVYAVVRPDLREIWVSFSGDRDGAIQVIDVATGETLEIIEAGKRLYHLVFTPRGDRALVSSNQTDEFLIYDANTRRKLASIPLDSPSGIFGVWRAFQTGL